MLLINKLIIIIFILALTACENSSTAQGESVEVASSSPNEARPEPVLGSNDDRPAMTETERIEQSLATIQDQIGSNVFKEPWTGDLDAMAEHRVIRVLTVYSIGRYYIERGQEKGITYEFK